MLVPGFCCSEVKYFQQYTDPEDTTAVGQVSDEEKVLLPLGENILCDNLGLPLVVVGAKVGHVCVGVLVGQAAVFSVSRMTISGVQLFPRRCCLGCFPQISVHKVFLLFCVCGCVFMACVQLVYAGGVLWFCKDIVFCLSCFSFQADGFSQLVKEQDFHDEHFDFIQQHIRKFCLRYGAALVYASAKDGHNCDVLFRYLAHRAYGQPFTTPASVVERDAVFV